jgi:hypothetical protein
VEVICRGRAEHDGARLVARVGTSCFDGGGSSRGFLHDWVQPLTLPGLSPFAGREPKAFTIHFYEGNANGFW